MLVLIDTTSCLLCVLMSVCANVFANEIGSEPVICECKQIDTHAHRGLMSDETLWVRYYLMRPCWENRPHNTDHCFVLWGLKPTSCEWRKNFVSVRAHVHMQEYRFLGGMRILVKCGGGNLFQMLNGERTMVLAHTCKHMLAHTQIYVWTLCVCTCRFLQSHEWLNVCANAWAITVTKCDWDINVFNALTDTHTHAYTQWRSV